MLKSRNLQSMIWFVKGRFVFTYFYFVPDEQLTRAFIKNKSIAIAYETVEGAKGDLPLLTTMSESCWSNVHAGRSQIS